MVLLLGFRILSVDCFPSEATQKSVLIKTNVTIIMMAFTNCVSLKQRHENRCFVLLLVLTSVKIHYSWLVSNKIVCLIKIIIIFSASKP